MPRKRRTANPEKALRLWIAPDWSARLRESRGSPQLSSDFSRYLDLADKVLAKDDSARADAAAKRPKTEDPVANGGKPAEGASPAEVAEALPARATPRSLRPRPPKHPGYPKPPKLMMPKPPATPTVPKPRKVNFPRPPRRDW